MTHQYDYLIIGGGITGLAVARALKESRPGASVLMIEKEPDVARHASGRNSGVLHAGFYYTADSLKARFTVEGNRMMRDYCRSKGLPVNACGKLVVAKNAQDLEGLHELERRGRRNGSNVSLISASQAERIEPNVRTFREALHSPDTASIDPAAVCLALKQDLQEAGVTFLFNAAYLSRNGARVRTSAGEFETKKVINCAGLYADKIARDYGLGRRYTVIPFKGIYLKYTKDTRTVSTNIYPVPNLKNPFLGVHFTKAVDGTIKIGPTAIPAFWRENYSGLAGLRMEELGEILWQEARLFLANSFNFRELALEEMRKYNRSFFVSLARDMVKEIDPEGFTAYTKPGIRAQLLDLKERRLVQDFVVETEAQSVHILNAVSPAFTCAFPFARYVVDRFLKTPPA